MDTTGNWYVISTRPRWEKKVAQELSKLDIVNYCPLSRSLRQWSDRRKIVFEPLFGSYVFVNTTEANFKVIRNIEGCVNFVYWLKKPAVVKNEEIETIKKFVNDFQNVRVEKVHVNLNDHVRVLGGPLMEVDGRVIEIMNKTVKILLPSLGYAMIAEIEKSNIELLALRDAKVEHKTTSK